MFPSGSVQAESSVLTIVPSKNTEQIEEGLYASRFDGDYGLTDFLNTGGASTDQELAAYLSRTAASGSDLEFAGQPFGCSTITASTEQGEVLFGRNFDWQICQGMVLETHPEDGYASVSTVNLDFIGRQAIAPGDNDILSLAAVYAPLDGMNEEGFAISVNMIQDSDTIDQNTDKPDLTTTAAIRLLLDHASDVPEALDLLSAYDMHASMGMMVHFALADATGKSVAVEYIDNKMIVTETPVLTNFYLAAGEKNGIGTQQSHERFEILTDILRKNDTLDSAGVRDALKAVGKQNFGGTESTEWSIVFHLTDKKAVLYHRENFGTGYSFEL